MPIIVSSSMLAASNMGISNTETTDQWVKGETTPTRDNYDV